MSSSNGTLADTAISHIIFHATTSAERQLRTAYLFEIGAIVTWIILFPIAWAIGSLAIYGIFPRRLMRHYETLWCMFTEAFGVPLWFLGWGCLEIFMHTGLSIYVPGLTYRVTLIPQLLPNECEASYEIEGTSETWPCFVASYNQSLPLRLSLWGSFGFVFSVAMLVVWGICTKPDLDGKEAVPEEVDAAIKDEKASASSEEI